MSARHSFTLTALCERLKIDLAEGNSQQVAASCGFVKTEASIAPDEWEGLGDGNRALLKSVCGYNGPRRS